MLQVQKDGTLLQWMWRRGNSENIQQTRLQFLVLNTEGCDSSSEEPGKLSNLAPTYTVLRAVEDEDTEPDTETDKDKDKVSNEEPDEENDDN